MTALLVLCTDCFGTEFFGWHPGTIQRNLERQFAVRLPDVVLHKIMAGVVLHTTDVFWKDVKRFIQLCNVLSGDDFDPGVFDPADSIECAWGITEALLHEPPEEGVEPFSDDIRRYVGFVLKQEGYVTAPDVLRIALDADWSSHVAHNFADDPELAGAIYKNQQAKTEEVETAVRESLRELYGQIAGLVLREGDAADVLQRLDAMLRRKETGP